MKLTSLAVPELTDAELACGTRCTGFGKPGAPALPSRLAWLASDTGKTREVADERLGAVVGQLEKTGAPVEGTVGADDPLLAFEDAIADFHPHHILIALRSSEESGWQERGLIEEVGERFELLIAKGALAAAAEGGRWR